MCTPSPSHFAWTRRSLENTNNNDNKYNMCTPSPSHFRLDQAREYNILIIMIINIICAPRPHPTLAWTRLENTTF